MADRRIQLLDQFGRPIERRTLTEEVAAPTVTGVRSPLTAYPGDGLNPQRLAAILKEADQGDPVRYMELAETIEERDLHYLGVLGTRKRSVAQLDITVAAASEDAKSEAMAQTVRDWLERDELAEELFDVLDAVGKGYAFTEIVWDTSEGQWMPKRLERRDQRWFRFERANLSVPLMLTEGGQEVPLPGGKFIWSQMKAKSGLPLRSGIARVAAWAWMFKAFTNRDWAIFTQTFGQPIRVGKYGPGATDKDRQTLYRAVANIAADCAAIMPDGMSIEFIETPNVGASAELYKERADWLDQQVSKGVLGQTATTDAISGGHAVSQEHREVAGDIERADARQLSGILNRDLIRVWVDLEYGPQKKYPRLKIGREEEKDVTQTVDAVVKLVPLGFRVGQADMRNLVGLPEPEAGAEVLTPAAPASVAPGAEKSARDLRGVPVGQDGKKLPPPGDDAETGRATKALHQAMDAAPLPSELVAEGAAAFAGPAMGALVERLRTIVASAGSLEAARAALDAAAERQRLAGAPPDQAIVAAMRQAILLAWLTGMATEKARGGGIG